MPPFTGSLDAAVPAENIVLTHYLAETDKWFAVSHASDDKFFTGQAATEPLARRAAGLRTLAHLEARAKGEIAELSTEQIASAKAELSKILSDLLDAVQGHNGPFPVTTTREILIIQLRAAKDLVDKSASKGLLAKWVYPPLLFLTGAFGAGIIGVYAERATELMEHILSG